MLKLKCCGSGSSGNSYALISDGEILLIDAGMKIMDMRNRVGRTARDKPKIHYG